MSSTPTEAQFLHALRALTPPGGRQRRFLQAHVRARGKALTMEQLARAAGYQDWRGGNLQYGLLATRIAEALGIRPPSTAVELLVESVPPKGVTNREWVLVMRPQFAAALVKSGWV